MSVLTGLDTLVAERFARLRGRRVGAICNPTSVDRRMRHLADLLHHAEDIELTCLFGPEHGVRGAAQDMEGVDSGIDRRTGVLAHSLYGSDVASLTPTTEQLDRVDALVFDVQDVGSRYYTFAATMLYAMKAVAGLGKSFVVLDRPNPIGGESVEGPTVRPGFESFVGAYPMPIRHGMTVGELARMFHAELGLELDLDVIPCGGWSRSMYWAETGLPWVMPSPNMPTPDTALVYPGGCLLEGTNLSEGRGTTRPFELWGAPWNESCAEAFAADYRDASVVPRSCAFRPMFHKHAGRLCFGVQPHVLDPKRFSAPRFYSAAIACALSFSREHGEFAWRGEPYEFVADPIAIDLLFGSSRERLLIEELARADPWSTSDWVTEPGPWAIFEDDWARDEAEFLERRRPFLLYE